MTGKPQPPRQFLDHTSLGYLLKRIEKHGRLLQWAREVLPATLAEHCRDCLARDDGRVILFTDSPAFASQLRFHGNTILAKLNAEGGMAFKGLLVRNLRHQETSTACKPMPAPSPMIIATIKSSGAAASSVELGAALVRLGTTMERYAKKFRP